MRLFLFIATFIIVLSSCNKPQKNIVIFKGEIKGMTKGTLLLEKVRDTTIVPVDSYLVLKDGKFEMKDSILSPEIYYIKIKEYPNDYILVFAEEGIITIKSKLEKFSSAVKISGSENQKILEEYKSMMSKFNNERLTYIKEQFEADKVKNQAKLDSLDRLYKNHMKRRYLYTANFAVNHADKEIAPYLALTELYNAKQFLLDTIANSMDEKTKNSLYGIQFQNFLKNIKKIEKDSL
jgi:hypothetical protein